jgi:diacylglycerol kinase family enzyme
LQRGRTRQVDVGLVKAADRRFYFLNIVGMGFTVDASKTAHKLKFFGNTAYTLATLWQVLKLKSYPLVAKLDGRKILKLFPSIYDGRHVQYQEISTHKAATINIREPAAMLLGPDGELIGRSPAEITCLHQDLTIFW